MLCPACRQDNPDVANFCMACGLPLRDVPELSPLVTGYHGTSAENTEAILREGFRISTRPWDWLGDGIYFWQDAPLRTRQWAEQHHAGAPAVLRAHIRLERCLDLLDVR